MNKRVLSYAFLILSPLFSIVLIPVAYIPAWLISFIFLSSTAEYQQCRGQMWCGFGLFITISAYLSVALSFLLGLKIFFWLNKNVKVSKLKIILFLIGYYLFLFVLLEAHYTYKLI